MTKVFKCDFGINVKSPNFGLPRADYPRLRFTAEKEPADMPRPVLEKPAVNFENLGERFPIR